MNNGRTVMVCLLYSGTLLLVAAADVRSNTQSIAEVFCGTQDSGGAKVYRYEHGTEWTDLTPVGGLGGAVIVMDLVWFESHLYAATRCVVGGANVGRVWRCDDPGQRIWSQAGGDLDASVTVVEVLNGSLYAATSTGPAFSENGRLYCWYSNPLDPPPRWVRKDPEAERPGFRSGIVARMCPSADPTPSLFLGALSTDRFWQWFLDDEDYQLQDLDEYYGSCIWDFGVLNGNLYAGAYAEPSNPTFVGPVYRMEPKPSCVYNDDTKPWFPGVGSNPPGPFYATGAHNWAVEPFKGKLYVGSGEPSALAQYQPGGKLRSYDPVTSTWSIVWQFTTTLDKEGVSALALQANPADEFQSDPTDDLCLYIGTGVPEGEQFDVADSTKAAVWRYSLPTIPSGAPLRALSPRALRPCLTLLWPCILQEARWPADHADGCALRRINRARFPIDPPDPAPEI